MSPPTPRERVWALLCGDSTPPALPRTSRGALAPLEPPTSEHRFLSLLPSHERRALGMAAHYMELANARPGEGLAAVLDEAEPQARHGDPEWVRYALRVFLAHHPEGQGLPVPSLQERAHLEYCVQSGGPRLATCQLGFRRS